MASILLPVYSHSLAYRPCCCADVLLFGELPLCERLDSVMIHVVLETVSNKFLSQTEFRVVYYPFSWFHYSKWIVRDIVVFACTVEHRALDDSFGIDLIMSRWLWGIALICWNWGKAQKSETFLSTNNRGNSNAKRVVSIVLSILIFRRNYY